MVNSSGKPSGLIKDRGAISPENISSETGRKSKSKAASQASAEQSDAEIDTRNLKASKARSFQPSEAIRDINQAESLADGLAAQILQAGDASLAVHNIDPAAAEQLLAESV